MEGTGETTEFIGKPIYPGGRVVITPERLSESGNFTGKPQVRGLICECANRANRPDAAAIKRFNGFTLDVQKFQPFPAAVQDFRINPSVRNSVFPERQLQHMAEQKREDTETDHVLQEIFPKDDSWFVVIKGTFSLPLPSLPPLMLKSRRFIGSAVG